MNEMIERVAEAIRDSDSYQDYKDYKSYAIAAIEAMRDEFLNQNSGDYENTIEFLNKTLE